MSNRRNLGEGKNRGGTQIRDRFEKMEAERLAAKKAATAKASMRGAEPMKDPRVSGSGVAFQAFGMKGVPTVYAEKEGGRRGGRGKRV
jgi:hypothetical protein